MVLGGDELFGSEGVELGLQDAELGFPDEDEGSGVDCGDVIGAEDFLTLPVGDVLADFFDAGAGFCDGEDFRSGLRTRRCWVFGKDLDKDGTAFGVGAVGDAVAVELSGSRVAELFR